MIKLLGFKLNNTKVVFSAIFISAFVLCKAQYRPPYQIQSTNIDGKADTIWVLFPDIQSSAKSITFSSAPLRQPGNLREGDSIMLDSAYKLDIIVREIIRIDSLKYRVMCEMPHRQNAKLQIDYWWFAGGLWVIEGITKYDPVACDHLTIRMHDNETLVVGLSNSRNCR